MRPPPLTFRFLQPGIHQARLKAVRPRFYPGKGNSTDLLFEIQSPPCEGVIVKHTCHGFPGPGRSVAREIGRLSNGLLSTDGPDALRAFFEVDYELTVLLDREAGRLRLARIYMLFDNE